jgi:DNA-binding transcriptional MerR regulator
MKAPDAFRTISEVAEDLDLPQHVLRFWETRFNQIKPMKRGGGRRYYRPEDVDLLRGIRLLLYSEGFTIRGVQRVLKEKGVGFVAGVGQSGSVQPVAAERDREAARPAPEPRLRQAPGLPEPGTDHSDEFGPEDVQQAALQITEREPPFETPAVPAAAPRLPAGVIPLSLESRRKIELALSDLLEAKRLLDQVR